jgi:hypothetical protein
MDKNQPGNQTAYQHNAHSSVSNTHAKDHGWSNAINRMIDQRYAFLALKYENEGYLFRGMSSGLFEALLKNIFWHYASDDRGSHFEKELDVLLLSQDFSDAFTIAKLWEQKLDACILIFKSEIFNNALIENKAAMMATAEPGVVFKYPFLTESLTIDDIDYLIVSSSVLDIINDREKSEALNGVKGLDFTRLSSIFSDLNYSGKLIFTDVNTEKNKRSILEKNTMAGLLDRAIISAQIVTSIIKPVIKA